ncbi:hypothetical protein B0T26DRAFT_484042 [Lasiosphaeria miniovina]|uniref:Uncharacterized protein n=1 Tax=Lasiosphaeria miniovina TaxID=1954250 RepID=A0AA40DP77_9PEZI|nr:uncharacterized protein B0T26DRAFT_484042 [Lasiosphaeria miniovina]KAK0707073.1 hypothetical protein B0T26DRAFT_484042 [Lasiosphaeria miniovina]
MAGTMQLQLRPAPGPRPPPDLAKFLPCKAAIEVIAKSTKSTKNITTIPSIEPQQQQRHFIAAQVGASLHIQLAKLTSNRMASRADSPDDGDPFYLTPDLPAPAPALETESRQTDLPPEHDLLNNKYESIDTLMLELQAWANEQGFSVKKARACNYIKDLGPSRVDISCLSG